MKMAAAFLISTSKSHPLDSVNVNWLTTQLGLGSDIALKAGSEMHVHICLQLERTNSLLKEIVFVFLMFILIPRQMFKRKSASFSELDGRLRRKPSIYPKGTLLCVINKINLLLLLITKVIFLENFRLDSRCFEYVGSKYFIHFLLSITLCVSLSPCLCVCLSVSISISLSLRRLWGPDCKL